MNSNDLTYFASFGAKNFIPKKLKIRGHKNIITNI